MNIAFDATSISSISSSGRGIGKYATRILDKLIESLGENDKLYLLSYSIKHSKIIQEKYPNIEARVIYLGAEVFNDYYSFMYGDLRKKGGASLELFLISNEIDVFFSPWHSGIPYNLFKYIDKHICKTKFVLTVHDMIPYVFPNIYLVNTVNKKLLDEAKEMLHYVDCVITISESAKADIIKYAEIHEEKIKVIYEAGEVLEYEKDEKESFFVKDSEKYILYTGGDDWRKNIKGLIEAYNLCDKDIKENYKLVIVCKLHNRVQYDEIIFKYNLIDKVILTDYVNNKTLHLLYKNASLFVFPSLYEGFGLPVLEAMMYDIPVITGDNSSMPELIGSDGYYFNADSPKSISKAIDKVLQDDKLREKIIKNSSERLKLFSWEKCCNEIVDFLYEFKKENLFKDNYDLNDINKRLKIAYFSPLKPCESEISDYSEELLPFLSKYVDIDIYTSSTVISNTHIKEKFNIYEYQSFEVNNSDYDIIVYQNGNSMYHWEILQYSRKYPGIVVMHDYNQRVFFDYIANVMTESPVDSDFIMENFILQYGIEEGKYLYNKTKNNLANAEYVELNRYSVVNALGVIVLDDYAKQKVANYSPMLPIKVISNKDNSKNQESNNMEKIAKEYYEFIKMIFNIKGIFYQSVNKYDISKFIKEYKSAVKEADDLHLFCDALFRLSKKKDKNHIMYNIIEDINGSSLGYNLKKGWLP